MIVKREDKAHILCEVGDLLLGRVFEHHDRVLMKIYNARQTKEVRAVDVEDGTEYLFEPDAMVIPLYAELIIRGECRL